MEVGRRDPSLAVVPVFGLDTNRRTREFLGTGFFTGRAPHLVTCHHVIASWDGQLGIVVTSLQNASFLAHEVLVDEEADVAILSVPGYVPDYILPLFLDEYPMNLPVVSLDYGGTIRVGDDIQISINTRHGGIVRMMRELPRFGHAGPRALQLSFAAPRGASGAPIMAPQVFVVLGVVRDNMTHEVHNAHLEPVFDQDGERLTEGVYLSPAALAVHSVHVDALLRRAPLAN